MNIASKEIHFMGFTMELSEGGEPPEELEEHIGEAVVFDARLILDQKNMEPEQL